MKIENQVCTLEQGKRLKELGVAQTAHFTWYEVSNGDDEGVFEREDVEWHPVLCRYDRNRQADVAIGPINDDLTTGDGEFCSYKPAPSSAYTVVELGVMLPAYYHSRYGNNLMGEMGWVIGQYGVLTVDSVAHATEAQARAAMLIYLLENNLTTAEDVNQRLLNS